MITIIFVALVAAYAIGIYVGRHWDDLIKE